MLITHCSWGLGGALAFPPKGTRSLVAFCLSFFTRSHTIRCTLTHELVFCVYIPGNQSGGSALCICSKPSPPHPLPTPPTHSPHPGSLQFNCSLPINNLKFMHFANTHTRIHTCHLCTHSASRVPTSRNGCSWVNPELSEDWSYIFSDAVWCVTFVWHLADFTLKFTSLSLSLSLSPSLSLWFSFSASSFSCHRALHSLLSWKSRWVLWCHFLSGVASLSLRNKGAE